MLSKGPKVQRSSGPGGFRGPFGPSDLWTLGPVLLICLLATRTSAHDRFTTTVTWDREIAPIVAARCANCHSGHGRAPMALDTYEAARPWARAIRSQVLTRRMPVWHAARGYGEFQNDPSLSPFEINLFVAWVDGGAPKAIPPRVPGVFESPAPTLARIGEFKPPTRGRDVTLKCGDSTAPPGLWLGLRPELDRGGSVRVIALMPDGQRSVVGWFRDFDPDFATTYWLRTPLRVRPGARVVAEASPGPCTLVVRVQ